MFHKLTPFIAVAILLSLLAGCTTLSTDAPWPDDLPPRKVFVDGYLDKRDLPKADPQKLETHLSWIKKFYRGTVIYPNGWNRATSRFLQSVKDTKSRQKLEKQLDRLGVDIANEWAQDNHIRLINNTNVATWGSAMRTAAEKGDQTSFVNKVTSDVASLLSKKLKATEIDYERYYPDDDYDSF